MLGIFIQAYRAYRSYEKLKHLITEQLIADYEANSEVLLHIMIVYLGLLAVLFLTQTGY